MLSFHRTPIMHHHPWFSRPEVASNERPQLSDESTASTTSTEEQYVYYKRNYQHQRGGLKSSHKSPPHPQTQGEFLDLPSDPRCWMREDVQTWIRHLAAVHGLPAVQPDRFLMNGKALCLMTMEMFCQRVPLGGKMLYKDFQLRLSMAMYGDDNNNNS